MEAQRAKIQRLEERLAILRQPRAERSEEPTTAATEEDDMNDQLGEVNQRDLNIAQNKKLAMLRGRRRRLEMEKAKLGL
jgi:hypothetical protein